jgi:Glyoxalase/Bleomycin resistance protein/Dioxygenase superfamily
MSPLRPLRQKEENPMSRVFGAIRQIGYIVPDIDASMNEWVKHGVGPWFYLPKVSTDYFRYRGQDSPVEMSIALANSGDVQIELIQQRNDAPSGYRDFLNAGRQGAQHLAYWTISGPKGAMFTYIKDAAASWDGTDPIKTLS